MREIPSAHDVAVVSGDYEAFSPSSMFAYWTAPERLVRWWPANAEVDLRVGGSYRLEWPDMGWVLEGKYTAVEPDTHLGFTWNWNHEPDKRERQVDIYFMPAELGTRVAIHHGPFGDDESERQDRQGILEGWIHFGMKLAGLKEGEAS